MASRDPSDYFQWQLALTFFKTHGGISHRNWLLLFAHSSSIDCDNCRWPSFHSHCNRTIIEIIDKIFTVRAPLPTAKQYLGIVCMAMYRRQPLDKVLTFNFSLFRFADTRIAQAHSKNDDWHLTVYRTADGRWVGYFRLRQYLTEWLMSHGVCVCLCVFGLKVIPRRRKPVNWLAFANHTLNNQKIVFKPKWHSFDPLCGLDEPANVDHKSDWHPNHMCGARYTMTNGITARVWLKRDWATICVKTWAAMISNWW